MHSVKTTTYDQSNNMQWYLHIFKVQKVQSPAKQFKELFSLSESLSMKWNHCFWGLTMFVSNFGVGSLEQSVKLGWLVILISLAIPFSKRHFFQTKNQKAVLFQCFHCLSCFSAAVAKENLLKTQAIVLLANFQIFKFCCDIQGSHLIGYLWVSLIIDQSECLICYFLCTELTLFRTELTLFHTELPENCIYP